MKRKSIPTKRTLAHSRIKNFVKCTETSGTTIAVENGSTMSQTGDAAFDFIDNGVVFNTDTDNATLGGTGAWDVLDNVAHIALVLFQQDGTVVNTFIGETPQNDDQCNYHFGGGDAGGWGAAAVGDVGASGSVEWTGGYNFGEIVRMAWKCNYGTGFDFSATGSGVDVDFAASSGTWANIGNVDNFDSEYSVRLNTATFTLYGMVMVEFPNGFPDDLEERINYTYDQWEAGNKVHFPVYEDE